MTAREVRYCADCHATYFADEGCWMCGYGAPPPPGRGYLILAAFLVLLAVVVGSLLLRIWNP